MGEKTKLQEMLEKKEKIRQGGGEKKVAKQHGAGKLTARERIDLLFFEQPEKRGDKFVHVFSPLFVFNIYRKRRLPNIFLPVWKFYRA